MIESTIVVKTSRIGKREKTYGNGNEILRLLHFLTFEKKKYCLLIFIGISNGAGFSFKVYV